MQKMRLQKNIAHFLHIAYVCPSDMSFALAKGKDSLAALRLPPEALRVNDPSILPILTNFAHILTNFYLILIIQW